MYRYIDKIFVGKMPNTYKKRAKKFRTHMYIYVCFSFIFVILSAFLMFYLILPQFYLKPAKNLNVTFNEMTKEQIKETEKLISEIKPIYLTRQKSITFTSNLSHYGVDTEKNGYEVLGYNGNRKIIILYSNNTRQFRETICHELLHSYLYYDDLSHEVIYDLQEYEPCFKKVSEAEAFMNGY